MDFGIIIFGLCSITFSIASSAAILIQEQKAFAMLSNQTKLFDCSSAEAIIHDPQEALSKSVLGANIPCMMPNLYKENLETLGEVEELLEFTIAYCKRNPC